MGQLPIVKWEDEEADFFFDERLKELRNVKNPHDRISLNEFELEYYRKQKKKS